MIGWDESSFAGAVDEVPVVAGLEVVVVGAEPVEEVVDGELRLGPVFAMVVLEAGAGVAALGGAGGVEEVEG
jgi:hypothetical protein